MKYGGGSLIMWGFMTSKGVGYSCRIDGRMDSQLYTRILGDEFMDTLKYYKFQKDRIIFQQDNDAKHTSKIAKKWFEDNVIHVLDLPSQSPDLNPIKHLWAHLKRQLSTYDIEPNGVHELWDRIVVQRDKIPADVCVDLISSMPKRVECVIKAKGGYTKY